MRPNESNPAQLATFVGRTLGAGRVLLIGDCKPTREQFAERGIEFSAFDSTEEFLANAAGNRGTLAIWFFADGEKDLAAVAKLLASSADDVLLIPQTNGELVKERPHLVELFAAAGFLPDYECDLSFVDSAAVRLRRQSSNGATEMIAGVESTVARLNLQLNGLQRSMRTRLIELETADRHIATLEGKLLKLKEARRELKKLKQEKQALRKSPERKIGQVLLAPYRLPQKLIREVRKRWPKPNESSPKIATEYQRWFEQHRVKNSAFGSMREEIKTFSYQPCFTIITPVYNTPLEWLEEAVQSVRNQIYEKWELTLIDDCSTDEKLLARLAELPALDSRIVVERIKVNCGISAASNRGIEIAQGDWIGLLDHDDVLEPDALFQNAKLLQQKPKADLIYSDEDKLLETGLDAPFFKPDWSPDFFLSYNYICHFTTIRRELVRQLGGFRPEYDFAQDYDLYLRVISASSNIHHIPRVLYHWRRSAGSTSANIRAKPQALEAARGALTAYLERAGQAGHVAVDWNTQAFRVRREIAEEKKIAIIIPTRNHIDLLTRCIASVEKKTAYGKYEIVIVDNDSESEEARDYLAQTRHRVLHFPGPFNYSAINNLAVDSTDAPWLLFLNNDTEVIDEDWLTVMAEHVQRPEVGAVGARLLFRDETVQHAGIVLGVRGTAKHAFCGFPAEAPGVCRQLQVTRNYSAVTAACLLTRRDVFEKVGGFDEERLPVIFNDVDLCLKIRQAGYLIVYTPFAKLYHDESASRRRSVEPIETEVLRQRWPAEVERDPYYNINLSRDQADFSLGQTSPTS